MQKIGRGLAAFWVLLLLALPLTGCHSTASEPEDEVQDGQQRRLLFVTDDIEDPFSAMAWHGLQQQAADSGVQVTLLETQGQTDKASAALNQASEGLYDLVILDRLAGEAATDWVRRNAGYYPNVRYLCLDALLGEPAELENVTWLCWDDLSIYYIYGVLAALNSGSGTVAYLGGEAGPRSEQRFLAFYEGAARIQPELRALYIVLGAAPAEQDAAAAVQSVLQEQADVFCVQTPQAATMVQQLLQAQDGERTPPQPLLLVGGDVRGEQSADDGEGLLATHAFQTQDVLQQALERCCANTLQGGLWLQSWQNEGVTLHKGQAYPGALQEEGLRRLAQMERDALEGKLDLLLERIVAAQDTQARITAAGEKREQPPQPDEAEAPDDEN